MTYHEPDACLATRGVFKLSNGQGHNLAHGFSKEDSLLLKGVAILMMLWIHCFFKGRFEDYGLSIWPFSLSMVYNLATYCKLCVSIFAFVSGYGLYFSFSKTAMSNSSEGDTASQWVWRRYVSTFSRFWLIVPIAWIVCSAFGPSVRNAYFTDTTLARGILAMILELTGIGQLMGLPTLITAWWYMGAALAYLLLTPLIYHAINRYGWLIVLGLTFLFPRATCGFPGYNSWLSFLPAFTLGMVFAAQNWFCEVGNYVDRSKRHFLLIVASLALITLMTCYLSIKLPQKLYWDMQWGLFVLPLILLSLLIFAHDSIPRRILIYLGTRSADIYLIHNIYRVILFPEFVYGTPHLLTTYALLLLLSLATSYAIDCVKAMLHYDTLIQHLLPMPQDIKR